MTLEKNNQGLLTFLGFLLLFGGVAYVPILRAHSLNALGGFAVPLIMWAPGTAAICSTLLVFRSLRPCGFCLSRAALKWMATAVAVTLVYTLLIQGLLSSFGIVQLGSKNLKIGFVLVGLPRSTVYGTGEEIGWRGFFTPLMIGRFGFVRANLLIGLLWALYHLPAMLFAGYGGGPGAVGIAFFSITVIGLSFFLGTARLASSSLWPAALFHGAHNLFFLHLFDPVKPLRPIASLLRGETGLLLMIVMMTLGGWSVVRNRRLSRFSAGSSSLVKQAR